MDCNNFSFVVNISYISIVSLFNLAWFYLVVELLSFFSSKYLTLKKHMYMCVCAYTFTFNRLQN